MENNPKMNEGPNKATEPASQEAGIAIQLELNFDFEGMRNESNESNGASAESQCGIHTRANDKEAAQRSLESAQHEEHRRVSPTESDLVGAIGSSDRSLRSRGCLLGSQSSDPKGRELNKSFDMGVSTRTSRVAANQLSEI